MRVYSKSIPVIILLVVLCVVYSGRALAGFILPDDAILVDTIQVSSYSSSANEGVPVFSNVTLEQGKEYAIKSEGTFVVWVYDGDHYCDAEWYQCETFSWVEYNTPESLTDADLLINGDRYNWWGTTDGIEFTEHVFSESTHEYFVPSFTGQEQKVEFLIYDSWYLDNSGSLTVEIFQIPEPATILMFGLGVTLLRKRNH